MLSVSSKLAADLRMLGQVLIRVVGESCRCRKYYRSLVWRGSRYGMESEIIQRPSVHLNSRQDTLESKARWGHAPVTITSGAMYDSIGEDHNGDANGVTFSSETPALLSRASTCSKQRFPCNLVVWPSNEVPAVNTCRGNTMIESLVEDAEGNVVVTLGPGYKHVLSSVGENDPALLIMWDDVNVRQTVEAFNAAVAAATGTVPCGGTSEPGALVGPPVPDWMALPAGSTYNEDILKQKILTHIKQKTGHGVGEVIGNALIAPNDFHGWCGLMQELSFVGTEPFFVTHAVCPIGRIYCLADEKHKTSAVPDPVHIPPYGVGVFQ